MRAREPAAQVRARALARAAHARAAHARAAQARAAHSRAVHARAAQQQATQQPVQAGARPAASSSPAPASVPVATSGSPEQIAASMLGPYGWSSSEFSCLNNLWTRESGWNPMAANSSGAYGIPQALPGSQMAGAGAGTDWPTNPATQIRWGRGYITGSYGSPGGAWSHELSAGCY